MGYPPELKKLIKNVEYTRAERIAAKKAGKEFRAMTLDERKQMLQHHPDYKEEGRRELVVGPSKGYPIAHEYCEILEPGNDVRGFGNEGIGQVRIVDEMASSENVEVVKIWGVLADLGGRLDSSLSHHRVGVAMAELGSNQYLDSLLFGKK